MSYEKLLKMMENVVLSEEKLNNLKNVSDFVVYGGDDTGGHWTQYKKVAKTSLRNPKAIFHSIDAIEADGSSGSSIDDMFNVGKDAVIVVGTWDEVRPQDCIVLCGNRKTVKLFMNYYSDFVDEDEELEDIYSSDVVGEIVDKFNKESDVEALHKGRVTKKKHMFDDIIRNNYVFYNFYDSNWEGTGKKSFYVKGEVVIKIANKIVKIKDDDDKKNFFDDKFSSDYLIDSHIGNKLVSGMNNIMKKYGFDNITNRDDFVNILHSDSNQDKFADAINIDSYSLYDLDSSVRFSKKKKACGGMYIKSGDININNIIADVKNVLKSVGISKFDIIK